MFTATDRIRSKLVEAGWSQDEVLQMDRQQLLEAYAQGEFGAAGGSSVVGAVEHGDELENFDVSHEPSREPEEVRKPVDLGSRN